MIDPSIHPPEPLVLPTETPLPSPPSRKRWLIPSLAIIIILTLGTVGFFMSQRRQVGVNTSPAEDISAASQPTITPSTILANAKTFSSNKFGFSIQYPDTVTPSEFDIRTAYRKYKLACKTGALESCGGMKEPEYRINFVDSNKEPVFQVDIHVTPISALNLKDNLNLAYPSSGIIPMFKNGSYHAAVKDGFSYVLYRSSEQVSELDSDTIAETFKFIEPEKTLKCLWYDEFVADFPKDAEQAFQSTSGFFYDQATRSCQKTTIQMFVLKGLTAEQGANIPFQTQVECVSTCITPKKADETTTLPGIWQANESMAAGWSDRYHFYPSGTYHYFSSQMADQTQLVDHEGKWQLNGDVLTLTTTKQNEKTLSQPSIKKLSFKQHGIQNDDFYPSISLNGQTFWKFSDDASKYGDEVFPE